MLLLTTKFDENLDGKIEDFTKKELVQKLEESLTESANIYNQNSEKEIDFDFETTEDSVVVNYEDTLEIYSFEDEGLMLDLSQAESHDVGNKILLLPIWYQGDKDKNIENTKEAIDGNPELVKKMIIKELNGSKEYNDEYCILLKIGIIRWEDVFGSVKGIECYISKESLQKMFEDKTEDKTDDETLFGSINIGFGRRNVIITSDELTIASDVDADTVMKDFKISMSRETYKDIENKIV